MDEQKKKILLAAGMVVFIGGVGFLLYYVFFRGEPAVPGTDVAQYVPAPGTGGKLPSSPAGTVVPPGGTGTQTGGETAGTVPETGTDDEKLKLNIEPAPTAAVANGGETKVNVVSASVLAVPSANALQGGLSAYDVANGTFIRMDDQGKTYELTDKKFFNVQDVQWSPSGNAALLGFADGSKLYYDFARNVPIRLPDEITDPSFNKAGDKIAFKWIDSVDSDRNYVGVSKPDGTGIKFVEFLGNESARVTVRFSPDEKYVATQRTGKTAGAQEIYFVGQNQENYKSLVVPGLNFEYKYSPNGKQIVYSSVNLGGETKPEIRIASVDPDSIGQGLADTGLKTFVEKCAFDAAGTNVYCAVPRDLPNGAGIAPELAKGLEDDFYRIDMQTGTVSSLARPVLENYAVVTAANLIVSPDGTTLYFTNEADGRLLSLSLR